MSDYNDTSRYRLPANLRQQVGLGRCSLDARSRGVVRTGLGIESIERGHLAESVTTGTDYTSLAATNWTALDTTNMSWDLWLSGTRPVECSINAGVLATATFRIALSLSMDGVEVTGRSLGMTYTYDSAALDHICGEHTIASVAPGKHRFQVVYIVSGGAGGAVANDPTSAVYVRIKEV